MKFIGYVCIGLLSLIQIDAVEQTSTHPQEKKIEQLSQENMQELLSSSEPLVIDVYAPWCAPCKALAPIFHEMSDQFNDYRFVKVDGDKETAFLTQFKIRAFPTVLFIQNGKEVGRHEGLMSKEQFRAAIIKHHKK